MNRDLPRPRSNARVTMHDVARLAGVSQQTVSRVLNGGTSVSPETAMRVMRAKDALGYRRNAAARALVTSRSMRLGVVGFGVTQFGPASTLFGIVEAARLRNYSTNLVSLKDLDLKSLRSAVDALADDDVEGIIVLAPVSGAAALAEVLADRLPMVRFEPGLDNGTTSISVDEVEGARLATRHLIELGHTSIWQVAGPHGWLGTDARIAGWRQELAAHDLAAPEPLHGDWSSASGYGIGQRLLEKNATAIFAANDQMALGVLKAFHDNGVSVPRDASIVGFDDIPEAAFFHPALTTVKLDFSEVGHRCVARLLEIIDGQVLQAEQALTPELNIRATTAPAK